MAFIGLGNITYNVPTKSPGIIPDGTFSFSVPIEQMTADAVALAWPNVMARVQQAMPSLIAQAWPAVVANAQATMPQLVGSAVPNALPYVPQFVAAAVDPNALDPAWPQLEPRLDAYLHKAVPAAWEQVKPSVRDEISSAVVAEERKAIIAAVLTATLVGSAGVWLWRKFT